ncbi:FAD:protein FMN transferase [Rhabdobacter roseus]|uniref:FAD:protein FMN transferase n=1 Tax=Rhabdobacter roseus TaxID=1655419 RepID=A0A840U308_9BACT|nr:FAD:protein FMN transferase [Rhabdobacter roseus]MBB5286728.1 thiamine biosynthesis lipoprotein [Rhabdobacter roseus]
MGSPFRLVFYASSDSLAQAGAERAFRRIEALNDVLSDYRDGSEINRLSAQAGTGEWVPVSQDLGEVLRLARTLSARTQGTFDPTVGPAVQLWRRAMRRGTFPAQTEIRALRRKIGYRYLHVDSTRQRVRLLRKGMRLDVGGIGKGYAADEAVALLREMGIRSVLVDAGGDLTLGDPPPGQAGWTITVESGTEPDPRSSTTQILTLANVGVATSGANYRYLEYRGKRYSHIVNPRTGVGLLYHVRTTVIAEDGTQADALATALSVAGIRRGKKLLKRFPSARVWVLEMKEEKVRSWKTL